MEQEYNPHTDPFIIKCKEQISYAHEQMYASHDILFERRCLRQIQHLEMEIDRRIHNMRNVERSTIIKRFI